MATLYLDLIGGISGDMTVAALLDLGVSFSHLRRELAKLSLRGYRLTLGHVNRGHMRARKFDVLVDKNSNFSYTAVTRLITRSRLKPGVKKRALAIYSVLRDVETRVHGHDHQDMPFDRIGDTDSVVDIVSAAICLEALGIRKIFYSYLPLNKSVAPATSELLKGKKVYFTGQFFENVTPTGMAICAALGEQFAAGRSPVLTWGPSGYGAGATDTAFGSNVLRAALVEHSTALWDEVTVLEANIDDMNPQFFEVVNEKLLKAGALDVFITTVLMKKSRPGFLLTVLSKPSDFDKMSRMVLEETTTMGVRFYQAQRTVLNRSIRSVTYFGRKVRVKLATLPGGRQRLAPEYDDCKIVARALDKSVAEVYGAVKKKAEDQWLSQD